MTTKKKPPLASEEGRAERGVEARPGAPPNVTTVSRHVKVEPLRDQLLVRPEPARGLTSALLTVVSHQQEPAVRGEVLAVGPEVRDVRVGQRVLFSKLQGQEVMGLLVLAEGAILATE